MRWLYVVLFFLENQPIVRIAANIPSPITASFLKEIEWCPLFSLSNKIVVEIIIVKEKKNKLFFVGKVSFGYVMAIYTFHNESTEGSIALDR